MRKPFSKLNSKIILLFSLGSVLFLTSLPADTTSNREIKSSSSIKTNKTTTSNTTKKSSKETVSQSSTHKVAQVLPRLLDLGAKKCIPCKMMAPLLEELSKEYKGKLTVEFIDVWENPDAGKDYKIRAIPTQIFYDADGKEFFRHEGYYPKEDILAKFKEQKIDISK